MTTQDAPPPVARLKLALFLLALLPLGRLLWAAWTGDFGPNPVEFVQRWTGTWTFNFLLLTLCITPLRVWTQWHWLLRLRRMLGLFTFFYATLHFLSFIGFDHSFQLDAIARDIFKRPFVTVGEDHHPGIGTCLDHRSGRDSEVVEHAVDRKSVV